MPALNSPGVGRFTDLHQSWHESIFLGAHTRFAHSVPIGKVDLDSIASASGLPCFGNGRSSAISRFICSTALW